MAPYYYLIKHIGSLVYNVNVGLPYTTRVLCIKLNVDYFLTIVSILAEGFVLSLGMKI
jgi:hypothetical protein